MDFSTIISTRNQRFRASIVFKNRWYQKSKNSMERLTKDGVSDFIVHYTKKCEELLKSEYSAEKWKNFALMYYTDDYLLVRPCGKLLSFRGVISFHKDRSVDNYKQSDVYIESIKMLGNDRAATVIYRTVQECFYKGEWIEDKATWTAVVVIDGDSIKFTSLHRSQMLISGPVEKPS